MAGISQKPSLVLKQKGKPFFTLGILNPLKDEGGVVFPFTPTIQVSHNANYGTYDVTGSVYQQNYYVNTPNPALSVTALFTCNTEEEARYTAAALHFFKTCTKSDFGIAAGDKAGTPPPILIFNAYGTVHAKNVPVVLRSFTYTMPEDTDYVEVDVAGEKISLPTQTIVSVELVPQLPPKMVKDSFSIKRFASGNLLNGGNNGGFI